MVGAVLFRMLERMETADEKAFWQDNHHLATHQRPSHPQSGTFARWDFDRSVVHSGDDSAILDVEESFRLVMLDKIAILDREDLMGMKCFK